MPLFQAVSHLEVNIPDAFEVSFRFVIEKTISSVIYLINQSILDSNYQGASTFALVRWDLFVSTFCNFKKAYPTFGSEVKHCKIQAILQMSISWSSDIPISTTHTSAFLFNFWWFQKNKISIYNFYLYLFFCTITTGVNYHYCWWISENCI